MEEEILSSDDKSYLENFGEQASKFVGMQPESLRSGNLNSLGYGLLAYPRDLAAVYSGSGVLNWIEFTTYFKESGSLSGVVKEAGAGALNLAKQAGTAAFNAVAGRSSVDVGSVIGDTIQIGQEIEGGPPVITLTFSSSDTRLGAAKSGAGDQVAIYIPGGIEYTDELEYETKSFAGLKALTNLSATSSLASLGVMRKLSAGLDKVAGLIGQESLNTGDAISASLGVVANPRKELLFQGVKFRTFDFKFVFIPRSEREALTVAKIIKLFRFHAYPELSANAAFFQFPSEFGIKFKTINPVDKSAGENPSLPKLRRCFLSKITTNFTPDDVYYSFNNGSSPKVEMTLSFQETDYIHRNLVKKGY